MKEIRLKRMEIRHFKGIKSLLIDFGDHTQISGRNGSGKTSIYEAYLWVLFGKDHLGNETAVQPYDGNNEIIHKIETRVDMTFDVNGVEFILGRSLKENWVKPRGQVEEVLKGRETTRYYNEVPVGESEFVKVLTSLCPLNQWLILSSVDYFLSDRFGTDKRRALLNSIAENFSEMDLATKYPAVRKAIKDGLNLDSLLKSLRIKKAKSKDELDMIPARIDQQEKLRTTADFDTLRKELVKVEGQLSEIDKELSAGVDTSKLEESKKLSAIGAELQRKMSAIEQKANNDYSDKKRVLERTIMDYQNSLDNVNRSLSNLRSQVEAYNKEIDSKELRRQELKDKWIKKNGEKPVVSVETSCPFCGSPYPEDKVEELQSKAVAEFIDQKKKALSDLESEASTIIKRVEYLRVEVEVANKLISDAQYELDNNPKAIDDLKAQIAKIASVSEILIEDNDYQSFVKQSAENNRLLSELSTESIDENKDSLKRQKNSLSDKRNNLIREISREDTNRKIDQEKERLNAESIRLGQEIADIENEEYQIEQFKKAKILKVQTEVDKHFGLVSFKMFEPNLTNDGEKKICQAIINGIPYESQNTATRINAGIDVVKGLSKVWEVSVPLFVDQKESVSELIETSTQVVTLTVIEGQRLKTAI